MSEQTTDYRTFVQHEALTREHFATAYELYQVADKGESHGMYEVEAHGEAMTISRAGNPCQLLLVHRAAVDGFLAFLRHAYMDGETDPDRWYAVKVATQRAD